MRYQIGGSLHNDDPSYVIRQADGQLYTALKAGDFCYVFNSRQMGKSSLLQRTSHRLKEEGYQCVYLDMTRLGSENTTPEQWYKGFIVSLFYSLDLASSVKFKDWWEDQDGLSPVQRLHQFVEEVLLPGVPSDRIFIFIDEIDSLLSLGFPVSDFFAWIRHCYNQQASDPNFKRLGFALFGVASPSDLIADKRRTPFNIGTAIELHGFQLQEATPLLHGLTEVVNSSQSVLREILHWTTGQPFLTQKLCQIARQTALRTVTTPLYLPQGTEAFWVEQLVRSHIIEHWESQDEPEHLRTIRNRLLYNEQRAGRLLGLYQRVLSAENFFAPLSPHVPTDDSREQIELLLSGIVEKRDGYLKLKNPIYRNVFHGRWIARQLDNLRPYSQTLNAWVASGNRDESRLLRGQALRDAQKWSQGKSLGDLDYQFLSASQESERREEQIILEAARVKEVEARLSQEKKTAKFQRFLLFSVCISLLIVTGLGTGLFILYRQARISERQARISEIEALVSSSEGLFASNRKLDALVEAIKAKQRLQKLEEADPTIASEIENVLRQAVYSADEYNRFWGHRAAVLSVAVSPDSSLVASASVDKTVKIWRRDGTEVATFRGHGAIVRGVVFSPDGQTLVSASDDGIIKLWRRDGTLIKTFQAHAAGIWGLAFSPDDQTIASSSFDGTVKLWRRDGTLLKTFQGYSVGFWGVAFSPDGQIVAAGSLDRTIKLWKRDSTGWGNAKLLQTLRGHTGWVAGVAFSPDGQAIASSSEDTTVKLWRRNTKTGTYHLSQTLRGHRAGIAGVAFSPDGQMIASASLDKTVKLWDISGTELETLRGHSTSVWGVTFSPDGSFITSAGAENVVRLWQARNPFQKTIVAHQTGIWSIAISSDSSTLVTAGHEKTAKLWTRGGKLLRTFSDERREKAIFGAAFSGDGKLIALNAEDQTVTLWRRDGTLVATYRDPSESGLVATALSPDGQTIAMANTNRIIKLWSSDFRDSKTLKGDHGDIWQVVFSPNGRLVASASSDGSVKLWTLDGKLFRTLQGHTAAVWRVAFSPDSRTIATGSGDNTVKLWTIDGQLLRTFPGHGAAVWGVSLSDNGQLVASGSVDTTVKLWDGDGRELTTLRGHAAAIRSLAMSRDGTFLASGGDDNLLILWNLQPILNLDASAYGCDLLSDYLRTNQKLRKGDRSICWGMEKRS